ncbi:MAG: histidine phosphatase family protein [Opitutales bacterium]
MSRLFLIRHGETEWARNGRHTSRTDLPLTDRGRSLAMALRHRLTGLPFALVLTSPLQRARQTCDIAGFRERAEIDSDLHEFDYGEYEGLTTEQIREKVPGWNVFTHPCPGGETLAQVAARADRVIARARAVSGDTLVFTHGHIGRTIAARWLAQPPQFAAALSLDTGTLNTLGFLHDVPAIHTWNAA